MTMTPTGKSERERQFEREAVPHMNVLYNFALRMTNNAADAEDLLQEGFLKEEIGSASWTEKK